jgi:hypothetical protein
MLLMTGFMGVPSLCVLIYALSFGAAGFFIDEVFGFFFLNFEATLPHASTKNYRA